MTKDIAKPGRPTASLSDTISAFVRALAEAQRAADIATIEQLFQIGLEQVRDGPSKIRTLEIETNRVGSDGNLEKHILAAPLAGLVPPSHLRVKSAEITFEFGVTELRQISHANPNIAPNNSTPFDLMGYVVQTKSEPKDPALSTHGTPQSINFKVLIESTQLSDNLGNLIDQIGNAFTSRTAQKQK